MRLLNLTAFLFLLSFPLQASMPTSSHFQNNTSFDHRYQVLPTGYCWPKVMLKGTRIAMIRTRTLLRQSKKQR